MRTYSEALSHIAEQDYAIIDKNIRTFVPDFDPNASNYISASASLLIQIDNQRMLRVRREDARDEQGSIRDIKNSFSSFPDDLQPYVSLGRPVIPHVLQPIKREIFRSPSNHVYAFEIVPFVKMQKNNESQSEIRQRQYKEVAALVEAVRQYEDGTGFKYYFRDAGSSNVGYLGDGTPIIVDGDATFTFDVRSKQGLTAYTRYLQSDEILKYRRRLNADAGLDENAVPDISSYQWDMSNQPWTHESQLDRWQAIVKNKKAAIVNEGHDYEIRQ